MYHDPESLSTAPDGQPAETQPVWRRDFPVDWSQCEYVARRDFTKFMVLTSLSFVVGQFWILLLNLRRGRERNPVRVIARLEEIPIGTARLFNYPRRHDPCVLVRLSRHRLVAFSQKCTHLSCPVVARPGDGTLHCLCHEGVFDLTTGRPLAGPPRRPLTKIRLALRDGRVYATGVEEGSA